MLLHRNDYHADICRYPIALYHDDSGIPHLIFAVSWNDVQIMNLHSRKILTALKTLAKSDAEEGDTRPYDYFYGQLHLSPDRTKFLSAGWVWGSADYYTIYGINEFIQSERISETGVGCWDHARMHNGTPQFERKAAAAGLNIMSMEFAYITKGGCLVAFSGEIGLVFLDLNGHVLYRETDLNVHCLNHELGLLLQVQDKVITMYALNP